MKNLLISLILICNTAIAKNAYKIDAKIHGTLNVSAAIQYNRQLKNIKDLDKKKQLVISINSFGGYMHIADAFIEALNYTRGAGVKVICIVEGVAFSGAFDILQAGCDERIATGVSAVGNHSMAFIDINGKVRTDLTAEEKAEVKKSNRKRFKPLADRSNMTVEDIEKHIAEAPDGDWTMSAGKALSLGVLDKVIF